MRLVATVLIAMILSASAVGADEEVFSGPQVGERLVPFVARAAIGETAGEEFDLVSKADGKPVLLIFVNEITRPSVALTRLIMDYGAKRAEDELVSGVVFLSADPTETANWMKRAAHALPKQVDLGISIDGQEGPGAYGLNRNVALTVLVAKANRVVANFALIQPSVQADAPKIAKEIVAVLGGGKTPTLAELGARGYSNMATARIDDPKLSRLVRVLIDKQASAEQVQKAIAAIDSYVADKPKFQQLISNNARRLIRTGMLDGTGTPPARAQLKIWAEKYQPQESSRKRSSPDA